MYILTHVPLLFPYQWELAEEGNVFLYINLITVLSKLRTFAIHEITQYLQVLEISRVYEIV